MKNKIIGSSKVTFLMSIALLGSMLIGCSSNREDVTDSTTGLSEIIEEQEQIVQVEIEELVAENIGEVYEEIAMAEGNHWQESTDKYDVAIVTNEEGIIDLTIHNNLMIGVELTQIMRYPESYVGKTIKMPGMYATSIDPNTGITYYYALIWDATNCCQIGMEFVLEDEAYPELGSNIVVQGTFHTYEEYGMLYCTLLDAKIV